MRRILVILLLSLSLQTLGAQPLFYSYKAISVEDGLSHPNITALLRDSHGTLWIGTKNGLNRFDRQKVKVYKSRMGDVHSLPDNLVRGLLEDSRGGIWVLTETGIVLYNSQQDYFEMEDAVEVYCTMEHDGSVYFGSSACLLEWSNGEKHRFLPFPGIEKDSGYDIIKMAALGNGELLLGTRTRGLFRYTPGGQASLFANPGKYNLTALYSCSDGSVLAATYGAGFCMFSADGRLMREYNTANSSLASNYIQDFVHYGEQLWIATDGGGISIFSPQSGTFTTLKRETGASGDLPSNSITCLHLDSFGTLWAGTVKHGLFQIKSSPMRTVSGISSGLADNAITSLYKDSDGTLWVGTDGGGIHKFDPRTGLFIKLKNSDGKILSIAGFGRGHLLVSMYMDQYCLIDKKSGAKTPFRCAGDGLLQEEFHSDILPRAFELPWGDMCFLGGTSYISTGERLEPLLMDTGEASPRWLALACALDDQALLYKDNNVYRLRKDDPRMHLLFSVPVYEKVTALAIDDDGRIWVGTNRGLGLFDGKYVTVPTYHFDDVLSLEWNAPGQLWICARNQLFTYLTEENRFVSWTEADGYRPGSIKMLYQNEKSPDLLYMGGSGGLVEVNRNMSVPQPGNPEIFLERITIGDHPVNVTTPEIRVPWKYRQIEASFLVKDEDVFHKTRFQYIMEGDSRWFYDSDEARFSLTAPEPGDYKLMVSCLTKGGTFSEPKVLLSLRILPPWYKTTWFTLLCLLLVMTLIIFVISRLLSRQASSSKNAMAHFLEVYLQEGDSAANLMEEPSEEDKKFKEKLDDIILSNISDPELGIKFLTDRLPYSRSTLYSKVKDVTGMGVKDYINRMRIERSVDLLLNTEKSINEIAYDVGFTYPRYFSTSFKDAKGVTPSTFKKENRTENV